MRVPGINVTTQGLHVNYVNLSGRSSRPKASLQTAPCFPPPTTGNTWPQLQVPSIITTTQKLPPPQANHITTSASTSSESRPHSAPPLILHHSSPSSKLNRALCLSDNVTPPSVSSTSAKIPNNRSVSDPGRPRLNGRSRRTRAIFPPCLL